MLQNAPDVMTVKEDAVILRCGRTKMLQLIYEGHIEARMICGKCYSERRFNRIHTKILRRKTLIEKTSGTVQACILF